MRSSPARSVTRYRRWAFWIHFQRLVRHPSCGCCPHPRRMLSPGVRRRPLYPTPGRIIPPRWNQLVRPASLACGGRLFVLLTGYQMGEQLSAVVIGASSIGKQHAKWLHTTRLPGGRSWGPPRFRQCHLQNIAESFGIEPVGYTDVCRMLDELQPHIVNICSPRSSTTSTTWPRMRRAATSSATTDLGRGRRHRHHQRAGPADGRGAHAAVRAVNTQYVSAPPAYYELASRRGHRHAGEVLHSQIRHTNKTYERVWVDIATRSAC